MNGSVCLLAYAQVYINTMLIIYMYTIIVGPILIPDRLHNKKINKIYYTGQIQLMYGISFVGEKALHLSSFISICEWICKKVSLRAKNEFDILHWL